MKVHKDFFLLSESGFVAIMQATLVNFFKNVVLCPSFLLDENTKQLDFTTQ